MRASQNPSIAAGSSGGKPCARVAANEISKPTIENPQWGDNPNDRLSVFNFPLPWGIPAI
jgi:hypothetical protein